MGHTPGPWNRDKWDVIGDDRSIVAKVLPWDESGCRKEDQANVKLIAAAPELLASCRELIEAMDEYEQSVDDAPTSQHREMMLRAMAAVEKATYVH